MKQLHRQLVEPWVKNRLALQTMPRKIKDKITDVLSLNREKEIESQGEILAHLALKQF